MKKMAPVTGLSQPGAAAPAESIFDRNGGRGLPKRSFIDTMTIGSGADQIELFYFGRGHTNGDAWILFPSLRVMTAGDIFAWPDQIPLLDANNGGSGLEIADTQMKAHGALGKRADRIITGHSAVLTFDDLRKIADFNRSFVDMVREGKKARKSAEEIAKGWTPPAGFTAPQAPRLQANVNNIYNEIK